MRLTRIEKAVSEIPEPRPDVSMFTLQELKILAEIHRRRNRTGEPFTEEELNTCREIIENHPDFRIENV